MIASKYFLVPLRQIMPVSSLITIAENSFYNIRGSFRIFGIINIGTHASLVRLGELENGGSLPTVSTTTSTTATTASTATIGTSSTTSSAIPALAAVDDKSRWVLLDSIDFSEEQLRDIKSLTNDGDAIAAIINVHPFHTVYTKKAAEAFPSAKLYGTARHHTKLPTLAWEPTVVESPEFPTEFASNFGKDFEFSVPEGVDFVPANENIHFSSVLAYHVPTKTVHSDDTFGSMSLPYLATWLGYKQHTVSLHPTLGSALQRRVGAAEDFRGWLKALLERWNIVNLVTAHNSNYLQKDVESDPEKMSINQLLAQSLESWEPTLQQHEQKAQQKAKEQEEKLRQYEAAQPPAANPVNSSSAAGSGSGSENPKPVSSSSSPSGNV